MSVIPLSGPARDVLTREEAAGRQARVRDVHYDLAFDLVEWLAGVRRACHHHLRGPAGRLAHLARRDRR